MLIPLFFITALLYSSIGFGGGSTYTALLLLTGTDYRLVPLISLGCNIIVVSQGAARFYRAGHIELRNAWPWMALSVPASFIGGLTPIREGIFIALLATCLLLCSLGMLFWPAKENGNQPAINEHYPRKKYLIPLAAGGGLGFLAGLTGIGGGIFLAPILHFLRYGSARTIAGTCSFFILVNSLVGVAGQIIKRGMMGDVSLPLVDWLLFPAVIAGGVLGTWLAIRRFNARLITRLTALLILFVALRLMVKIVGYL